MGDVHHRFCLIGKLNLRLFYLTGVKIMVKSISHKIPPLIHFELELAFSGGRVLLLHIFPGACYARPLKQKYCF